MTGGPAVRIAHLEEDAGLGAGLLDRFLDELANELGNEESEGEEHALKFPTEDEMANEST